MDFTKLVQELGIDKLPEDRQKTIYETIFRTLNTRVSLRLAHELTDEQKKLVEEAAKNGNDAAFDELERIYPNIKQVYQEEIDGLKDDMKAIMPE